jgi:hypothetical protein
VQSDVSPETKISTLRSYILHVRVQYAYIPTGTQLQGQSTINHRWLAQSSG